MCTLTLIPRPSGGRLAFNRDELRTRPHGLPPQRSRFGDRTAVLPIDPVSDGTWIAVNDAGLVLALLNVNPPDFQPDDAYLPLQSRGAIIPELLECVSLRGVIALTEAMSARSFRPFHLVAAQGDRVADWRYDGIEVHRTAPAPITGPRLFTSSGLGDEMVEGPRRRLFVEMLTPGGDWPAQQDAFHRHGWPDRSHLSVCMRRSDACTVSHTVIEWTSAEAQMIYHPGPPDEEATSSMARILFEPSGAP